MPFDKLGERGNSPSRMQVEFMNISEQDMLCFESSR